MLGKFGNAGFGGGKGYATGSQAQQSQQVTPIAQRTQSAALVNRSYTIVLAATNTPQAVAGVYVPDGCAVRVRANNGTSAGNTKPIFVASSPSVFKNSGGTPLAPLDDIAWPVRSGAQIWVYGTEGDGIVVSVLTAISGIQ